MKVRCKFSEPYGWQCTRASMEDEKFCKEHMPGSNYVWVSLGEEKGIERGYYRQRPPAESVTPPPADLDPS